MVLFFLWGVEYWEENLLLSLSTQPGRRALSSSQRSQRLNYPCHKVNSWQTWKSDYSFHFMKLTVIQLVCWSLVKQVSNQWPWWWIHLPFFKFTTVKLRWIKTGSFHVQAERAISDRQVYVCWGHSRKQTAQPINLLQSLRLKEVPCYVFNNNQNHKDNFTEFPFPSTGHQPRLGCVKSFENIMEIHAFSVGGVRGLIDWSFHTIHSEMFQLS